MEDVQMEPADTIAVNASPTPAQMTAIPILLQSFKEDDNLIRNRRVIHDRPLKSLVRALTKLQQRMKEPDFRENEASVAQVLEEIHQMEALAKRNIIIQKMGVQEVDNYRKATAQVEREINQAKADVEALKARLAEAQRERRNKVEYDNLARVILALPSRKDMGSITAGLQSEITSLQAELRSLEDAWELRRKQFHTMVLSGVQLQETIADGKRAANTAGGLGELETEETKEEGERDGEDVAMD